METTVLVASELGANPMQKFIELLHWEYHTGVNQTKRYLSRNKRAALKRYRPKAGVEIYVAAQIKLLPVVMQKIALAVETPKSIDLLFTVFTPATEYILQNDSIRVKVEVMSVKKFITENIEAAISMEPYQEEVEAKDIERYKYFYWNVDLPHMTVGDTHRLMRQFDTDDVEMGKGYGSHVQAYYSRSPVDYVLKTIGVIFEEIEMPTADKIGNGLSIMADKLKIELSKEGFTETAEKLSRSIASIFRAIIQLGEQQNPGDIKGKLDTKTEHEGDPDIQAKRAAGFDLLIKAYEVAGKQ